MKKRSLLIIVCMLSTIVILSGCKKKPKYDYLVLVNKYSQLPDSWEENIELVDAKNAWDEDIKVEKEAYKEYEKLRKALEKEGVIIKLDSVYRSVKDQQQLWDDWSKDPELGIDYVRKYVAVPGYSEHHTGLALDICIEKEGELIYENDAMIAEREIFSKIHSKLADYGFILRYLENKDDITGYAYEPWHLRYIGNKEVAKEIQSNNLTLEEYFDKEDNLIKNKEAAKYRIEKVLLEELQTNIYGNKIDSSRFNIKEIYTTKDVKEKEFLSVLNLGEEDLAFEVEYQIKPIDDSYIEELSKEGEYDIELNWIKNINRVGVLRKDSNTKEYKLEVLKENW